MKSRLFSWYLIAFCLLGALPNAANSAAKPIAKGGLLDLSHWNFEQDGPIELNGQWQFYWSRHLDSGAPEFKNLTAGQFLEVPGNWNDVDEQPATGFATYRLEVLLAEPRALGLKLRTVGTAYKIFADGKELIEVGSVGQSATTTSAKYHPKIVQFTPQSKRLEIIVQVANFEHRNAGLWESVVLGDTSDLNSLRQTRLFIDLVLFGAIVMMALYNLITWLTRRENMSGLWLGLFCLTISTRILLVDERYINDLLEGLSWSLLTRFEHVSWAFSLPIFLALIRSLFPTEASLLVLRGLWSISTILALLACLLPIETTTELVPLLQLLTLVGVAYGIYCIGLAIWRSKSGSILFGIGTAFLFLSAVSDIITVVFTLDTDNKLEIGLFLFVLLQTIQVSLRSSRAFQMMEDETNELRKTNLELHIQEKLRRASEGDSKLAADMTGFPSERISGFGVISQAVADRFSHTPLRLPSTVAETLTDVAKLLRGQEVERGNLDLQRDAERFFHSDEFATLHSEYPLVEVEAHFDVVNGLFRGSETHISTLFYHLAKYSFGTQIHAQQIRVSGRTDYVYAGSLFHHQVSDGHYYIVAVEDQGQGIRPEDLVDIFDPAQRGSGYARMKNSTWDLAVVWTILEDHGGALDLHSFAESTRLELYFPIVKPVE